jgi:hypothetical protein
MTNATFRGITFGLVLLLLQTTARGQDRPAADTVVVPLAETSKIIFTIQDRRDLDVLKHYDFQKLFDDIFQQLRDSTENAISAEERGERGHRHPAGHEEAYSHRDETSDTDDDDSDDNGNHKWEESRLGRIGQTWQSTNVDLGTNNYLAADQFPDGSEPYAVRPWGSWYVAVNSVQRTRLGKNIFAEWGLGVSWYNFKFQDDNMSIQHDGPSVQFLADARQVDFVKSKLGATFINASLLPVLDFSDHGHKRRMWDGNDGGFRFGIGPYVGYRISSKTKLVYETDGDKKREKDHDSFYLNNLRYGIRLQLGIRSTDLFVNYDLNDLFANDKGPKLNAVSFGLIL